MSTWNERLTSRIKTIKVEEVIVRKPEFIIIRDSKGIERKPPKADFPFPEEWEQIEKGSEIELVIREVVVGARVKRGKFQQKVQVCLNDLKKEIAGYFFMWVCWHCKKMGYVRYEDGDDFQATWEKIIVDHQQKAKADCDKTKMELIDHLGMRRKYDAQFLSFEKME